MNPSGRLLLAAAAAASSSAISSAFRLHRLHRHHRPPCDCDLHAASVATKISSSYSVVDDEFRSTTTT
jgi:hypothetical protein